MSQLSFNGPYHRLSSPTQTFRDVIRQVKSEELWGSAARFSNAPAVKAYFGPLPVSEQGIEFYTSVPHTSYNWMNGVVTWAEGAPGVTHKFYDINNNRDYVGIPIALTGVVQFDKNYGRSKY